MLDASTTTRDRDAVRRERLREALVASDAYVLEDVDGIVADVCAAWEQPAVVGRLLAQRARSPQPPIVAGPIADRFIALPGKRGWTVVSFGGRLPRELPVWDSVAEQPQFARPDSYVSAATLPEAAVQRLSRPRVSLVALYHPEVFPLPRFALGIADVASAVRRTYQGVVHLHDMQLGASLEAILAEVERESPDIIGVSATFGQHDILHSALRQLTASPRERIIVAGGSLSALNAESMLCDYPSILVASGPGEATAQDLIAYWHGDIGLDEVRDIKWQRSGEGGRTMRLLRRPRRRPTNRELPSILPELDLLDPTLKQHGVMQLESSRGCTHACSFCPREHKGQWHGDRPEALNELLPDIDRLFARYPNTARKIYLVDEEFIGLSANENPLRRTADVVSRLHDNGFLWEANTRIDQVYREDRDRAWNLERLRFWEYLRNTGLDRCLFGVESGHDSILRRFNKRTTSYQNVIAIRTLTALGIPIRCTYITFDPLMTLEELEATFQFQGRNDLMLRQVSPGIPLDELVDAVHDERFVAEHASGLPFYTHISYMLVSMECLIGSAYLKAVEEQGLARDFVHSMGRRNAEYKDRRIGLLSLWGQRWVDRNFSLDYTLKSLEKLSAGKEKSAIRQARYALRRSAYELLATFLDLVRRLGPDADTVDAFSQKIESAANEHLAELVSSIDQCVADMRGAVLPERLQILTREIDRWQRRTAWNLINST